tara:strand:+ start:38 stop:298 length:261 start_codon:yes stop_codon:yes gene_type:complete
MAKKIKFSLYSLFYTPKNESELNEFINRYNGSDKALVSLSGVVYTNYILNKINKEFDVYKKDVQSNTKKQVQREENRSKYSSKSNV